MKIAIIIFVAAAIVATVVLYFPMVISSRLSRQEEQENV